VRLLWSDEALADLDEVARRAPRQARWVHAAIEALADAPFPGMYRQLEGRPDEHVLSVPPYAVFYLITGPLAGVQLVVLRIRDSRRRRESWK
jgi:plasmid stabilization system protein ParE